MTINPVEAAQKAVDVLEGLASTVLGKEGSEMMGKLLDAGALALLEQAFAVDHVSDGVDFEDGFPDGQKT